MMRFTDLPIEVIDDIFSDIVSLAHVPRDIRLHWYRHLKGFTILRLLQLTELQRIQNNELSFYIDFGLDNARTKSTKSLVIHYKEVLPFVNHKTFLVLPFAQVWPGSEMYIGFWRLYLFTYPFCLDAWNHWNGNELRLSDIATLKPIWSHFPDSYHTNVQSLIEDNPDLKAQIHLTRRSIFAKMHMVYLHLCPSSLSEFSRIDHDLDPSTLSIKIVPDGSQTIVRELSGHKFRNLEAFSLEYVGPESHVDVEAVLYLIDLDKIKRLALHVSLLNVTELLWRLKHRRHDSFILTTSVLTYGRIGLCTSSNIAKLLKMKFNRYTIYTTDEQVCVSQPRLSQTDNVLTPLQQRSFYGSYH